MHEMGHSLGECRLQLSLTKCSPVCSVVVAYLHAICLTNFDSCTPPWLHPADCLQEEPQSFSRIPIFLDRRYMLKLEVTEKTYEFSKTKN